MTLDILEDCVLVHPKHETNPAALREAERLGLPLKFSDICSPGHIYVLRPSQMKSLLLDWPR